jgi:hypothetical protein
MPAALEDDLLILVSDVARHIRTYGDQLAQVHGITRAQLIISRGWSDSRIYRRRSLQPLPR